MAQWPAGAVCLRRHAPNDNDLVELRYEPTNDQLWFGYKRDLRNGPGHGYVRVSQYEDSAQVRWDESDRQLHVIPVDLPYDPGLPLAFVFLAFGQFSVVGPAMDGGQHIPHLYWTPGARSTIGDPPEDPRLPFAVRVMHHVERADGVLYFGNADEGEAYIRARDPQGDVALFAQAHTQYFVRGNAVPGGEMGCV